MNKNSKRPVTKTKKKEPLITDKDWIVWAAWADRITFEEIKERTGYTESEVIRYMRRSLNRKSFNRWRKRATKTSIKHRKKFEIARQKLNPKHKTNWGT